MNLYDLMLIVPAVLTAYVISYISMPVIIKIAGLKEYIDAPDGERKLQKTVVPTLGGIGIISAFIISYSVWGQAVTLESYPFFIAGLFVLFLTGIKDDLLVLSPAQKLIVQVATAILLVFGGGIVLTDFGGVFGFESVHWFIGAFFSVVILIAIINAYNLIDGIDGLAGGVGVIASGILGIWFWGANFLSLAVLSFSLSGALIGFLTFNMYPAKIFMGDTGAMAIGFILGYLSLEFLTLNASLAEQAWHIPNGQIFAVSILIIPIIDTLRVIIIRVVQGLNPFAADRNHIHHKLLDLGMSHHFAAFSLWIANILMIGIAYSLMQFEINIQLFSILLLGFIILPAIRFIYIFRMRLLHSEDKSSKSEPGSAAYDIN